MPPLENPRHERFCEEYLVDLNATAAYKRTGYSATGNAAEASASRLLSTAKVQARIKELAAERRDRTLVTEDWVIRTLLENANRALQAQPVLDREGDPTGEYRYEGNVANRSLELLGKHLKMFSDNIDLTSKGQPLRTIEVVRTIREDDDEG